MSTGRQRVATVAIVGRPNVGKSTLFNRLVGRRRSITLDTPGVTRDPISEEVVWDGHRLRLVDTGGLAGEAVIDLAERVHEHTLRSVRQADLVVALLDARSGLLSIDAETVDLLTKLGLPVLYVANKTDGAREEAGLVDFCRLGIDVPLGVSAEHGHGIGELRSAILGRLDQLVGDGEAGEESTSSTTEAACRVAIVGRPNVGKSSLLNALAGAERALVDDAPGTTRDTIDTEIEHRGRRYLFVDTAGMRRPSKVTVDVEKLSVGRGIHAVRRANVVLLLIEPVEGITDQDARIARLAWDEGRALVIAMNKIDLLDRRTSFDAIRQETRERYPTLAVVPIEFLSIHDGRGIETCLAAIERADRAHRLETATPDLNRILATAVTRREPPVLAGGRLRLFYVTQVASRPPTLAVFANRERIPADYSRFLERCFRESLDLEGSPLRLRFRRRSSHSGRE